MRKLILLRGNSGSGKSTVAAALQKRLGRNTLLIPQDTVRRDMLKAKDGPDTTALPLLMELVRYGNKHCGYTILEGILHSQWYKPLFQLVLDLYGENLFAYYYDIPFDETLKRHQTKAERLEFGEEEMRRWWVEKDYVGLFPEKTLTMELSLENAVELIWNEIKSKIPEKPT